MLKPLFDIQRVYNDGSHFHYEVFYKFDKSYSKFVGASFLTWRAVKSPANVLG